VKAQTALEPTHTQEEAISADEIRKIYRDDVSVGQIEAIINFGRPSDRESLRRLAQDRVKEYGDMPAMQTLKHVFETALRQADAKIMADYENHKNYLLFEVNRNQTRIDLIIRTEGSALALAAHIEARNYFSKRVTEIEEILLSKLKSKSAPPLGRGTGAETGAEVSGVSAPAFSPA
jgi:hypothetical protein